MSPDACSNRSRIISPQLPCIFESPLSARVRLLASSLRRLLSSTSSLMRSPSEKRSFDSVLYTCSTFSWKSLIFSLRGFSRLFICSALSLVKSSVLLWKMRFERFSNSMFMRLCKASASSFCCLSRASHWLCCSLTRASHWLCCSLSRSLNDFSCAASRSLSVCSFSLSSVLFATFSCSSSSS